MIGSPARRSTFSRTLSLLAVIYHATVRSVRDTHRNAIVGFLLNMAQSIMLVAVFWLMFDILGMRGSAVRGDFLLYLMTGIFMFIMHIKTVRAVMQTAGPASAIMQHTPMNTYVALMASALSALYTNFISIVLILTVYNIFVPISFYDMSGAFFMFLLAWFVGVGVGLIFYAIRPWAPAAVNMASMLYMRANMIASGKMFLANTLPSAMLALFDWNPLFHIIDQARGFTFINYNPHFSTWEYAWWAGVALLLIGMLGEFFTRKHASSSWSAAL